MQKIIILLGAAFAGLLLIYWLADEYSSDTRQSLPAMIEVPVETPPVKPQPQQSSDSELPPSNEERKVNIQGHDLSLDSQGSLIPTPAIRQLFNDIALKQGEVPVDQWKDRVLDESKDQLPPAAFDQLKSTLNRFIEYNLALQMLPMEGAPSLEGAMERVKSLRADYLGLTNAEGMYSDWEQLEEFTDDYLSLMLTETNPNQVQLQLQEKIEALPSSVQPRAQKILDQSDELLSALAVAIADPDGFKALAEQTAAQALIQPNFTFAEPDPKFMKRFEEYKVAKQELVKNRQDSGQYEAALRDLRKELFSGTELLRVETLERSEQM